ncbi:uncharacterized protein LOC132161741 [Corylus avellana]|uniref:uncharacterized protein LOC132161741 n=1 Tax=Corylus avellana TaxID=13451 RepID=UPI00286C81C3|nr:uncharacterized protein LOC132161741 [Corylus avellana]
MPRIGGLSGFSCFNKFSSRGTTNSRISQAKRSLLVCESKSSNNISFCLRTRATQGKTSQVPKSFLVQILGEQRVTKFVIQEIINSTMSDFVKKENLNVKDQKINTIQTAEELKSLFTPGKDFGFNATIELENSEIETSS